MLKKNGNSDVALLCPKKVRFVRLKAFSEFATNSLDINAKGGLSPDPEFQMFAQTTCFREPRKSSLIRLAAQKAFLSLRV